MKKFYISQTFNDHECFAASVFAWDLDFIQLSCGQFFCDITQFGDQELSVADFYLDQHIHQRGSAPPNSYTFAIHHQDSKPHRWRSLDCQLDGLIVFPENNELQSFSSPGFHQYPVSIEENFLTKVAMQIGLPEPHHYIRKGEASICDQEILMELRYFLGSLCHYMKSTDGASIKNVMNHEMKWKITCLFLLAAASSTSVKPRTKRINNNRIVNRVLEYVDSDLSVSRSIPELCRVAEVDERTLRNIFYDLFSLSPQKYMKCYRLNIVRKALQTSSGHPSQLKVADIANINGFWHMGQFAKDYRRLFDELPSETFRKRSPDFSSVSF